MGKDKVVLYIEFCEDSYSFSNSNNLYILYIIYIQAFVRTPPIRTPLLLLLGLGNFDFWMWSYFALTGVVFTNVFRTP
jgi:hypothetical protein